jgi:hypothetical protein
MQKVHGITEPALIKHACTGCRVQKARCEGGPPCSNCLRRGIQCSKNAEVQQIGHVSSPEAAMSHDPPTESKRSRSGKERRYIDLYFKLFHPSWPLIHQGSFRDYDETPLLIQSINVIGLWLSNEDNAQSRAIALHDVLSFAVHEQTVCDRPSHPRAVFLTNHERRSNGTLPIQKRHAVPVSGLSRHTRLFYSI